MMLTIKAVMRKEFIHLLRDTRTLRLIIGMPILQLMIYGYGINTDVQHLATIVNDLDQTPMSRRFVQALVQSKYFEVVAKARNMADVRRALDRGQAKVGLRIPPGFARDALAGKVPSVQFLVDGSDSNPANTAVITGQAVVTAFTQREGLSLASPAVMVQPRLWYNPDLKSAFFMVPGVVGLLLQLMVPMVTATAVVREKERGNIEQLLVTPIRPLELMVGKIIPYVVLGLVIATTVLFTAHFLFSVPIRGNLLLLFILTLLYITVCLGIGMLASTLADNQNQASQMIVLFAAPSILLSGFIFPRETMPAVIHAMGYLIPLTYYLKIIRGMTLKGLGFADLWTTALPLLAMSAILLVISVAKFRKRLA